MAEHSRGQGRRRSEDSSHNKVSNGNPRQPQSGYSFEGMNFEQRRRPYDFSKRSVNNKFDDTGEGNDSGRRREVP
jgi:hypothetical protein